MRPTWTDEEIAIACRKDITQSERARIIGCTRNAVAGMKWRKENPDKVKARYPSKSDFVPYDELAFDDETMDLRAARTLWISKIRLMIEDACGRIITDNPSRINRRTIQKSAREWFESEEFKDTCEIAGLPVTQVYASAQLAIMEADAKAESAERESRT